MPKGACFLLESRLKVKICTSPSSGTYPGLESSARVDVVFSYLAEEDSNLGYVPELGEVSDDFRVCITLNQRSAYKAVQDGQPRQEDAKAAIRADIHVP